MSVYQHVNTVGAGIPGLTQFMGVQGFSFDSKAGELVQLPEDASKRGMSSALEQEFVEACLGKASGDYNTASEQFKTSPDYQNA
jgi:hypothetical protein